LTVTKTVSQRYRCIATAKMPKIATPLTETQVRLAKPTEKPYKLTDGGGIYLLVKPSGSKLWQFEDNDR
jgi:hypothetical protein